MKQARAQLNSYRQSPRKVRLVADLVRGKSVEEALDILTFVPKRAGEPLKKLISSAHANLPAGQAPGEYIVKEIRVDEGPILYRSMPRSRGMANRIRKRTSHISVTLSEMTNDKLRIKNKKIKVDANKLVIRNS